MKDLGPVTKLGMGRRSGEPISDGESVTPLLAKGSELNENGKGPMDGGTANGTSSFKDEKQNQNLLTRTRSKRKKRNWQPPTKQEKKDNASQTTAEPVQ